MISISKFEQESYFKENSEKLTSSVDFDQLEEYSLMEQAGYIYTREVGKKIEYPVKSINYLFDNKYSAKTNKPYLDGYANTWYVNEKKQIVYLEDE